MAALTIYYGGVDITDYVRQETIRIESSGSALAAICRLVAEDRLGQEPWFNPAEKSELVIYDGITRIFGGWANIVDAQHDGPIRGFPIRASDYTVQLEEHIVVDTFTAAGTSDQALIQEMFANWCVPIDATVHVQVVRAAMPEMHFRSILIRQAMDNICRKSGGMYYVDFDKRLHYFLADEGVSAPDILSTEPNEVTRWPYQLRRRRFDASKLCNNVLVIGNGIEVWREHAASIAHYDFRYQDTLQDRNVDTAEEAEYLGDWYLARHAWPNETLEVTCWRPGLRAGQNIRLINSVLGIDQFYSIRKASIRCTGAYEPDSPQFVVRLKLGLQDAPGRPDFEPPPHQPLPPPVPPAPEPPPDAGWRKEVWVATKDLGPFHTPDFVTDTRYAHGVPTWTAINAGLTLVGEDCLGFRGDPFDPQNRHYCLMTDGAYRRVAPGNWVSILTWAAAQAAAGGDFATSHFGHNGIETSINQQGHVAVLFNAVHTVSGGRAVMFVSGDYGATWTMQDISGWQAAGARANSLTIGAFRGSSPYAAGQVMYAIGRRWANTYLWYSTDGGASWGRTVIGLGVYTAHCLVDPNDQSRVFVGCLDGAGPYNVGVSLDHGVTVAQYDGAASEDTGYPGDDATYYQLSVAMDPSKMVRVGADVVPQHIHTTRDDGVSWEETTPEFSTNQLGISIVQDAPNFLYLLRQAGTVIAAPHLIWASENEGRDMIPKSGANANIADTGGGDSIPYNSGGIRGILQIWTDRAEGDIPGVPSPRDIGQFPGEISEEQLVAHAPTHENGGSDEINVGGLSGLLADPQTPLAHAATHENGGADEVGVGGLSGLLADPQTPLGHGGTHQNGGADEINVGGLDGVLADEQDAGWLKGRTISANVPNNADIYQWNLGAGEWQPVAPGAPGAHAASHEDGGIDEIDVGGLSGDLADEQDPKAHDHQGVGSDGGKLSGAIVDSFQDFEEIGAPANPGVNVARVYSRDDAGTTKFYYRRSDGTEVELGAAGVSTDIGCRIFHNVVQAIPSGAWTALAFNSERRDDGGLHNPAVNNSRITFGQAGWYSCFGNVQFATGAGSLRGLLIRKNGATIIAISSLNLIEHKFLSSVYYFVPTDYIELEAYQNSGGNLNIQSTAEYTPEFAVMIGSR